VHARPEAPRKYNPFHETLQFIAIGFISILLFINRVFIFTF